ncbi:response regulator [Pseudodesulfovibrio indicus]|uniref:response regulator n=1 Tax=Pseudodesulfovibrio indicus TaxID=1716143 RepID=UPI00292F7D26|nr:response regulator [Pseudodesulfovibrio indicus]
MNGIRILIVDDEIEFAAALAKRLVRRGASASVVESGEKAFTALEERRVDVVLLDMNMPDLDGMQILKIIRKNFPATAVILLTGAGDLSRHMRTLEAGAFDFLHKPVTLERLQERILAAVGRKPAG